MLTASFMCPNSLLEAEQLKKEQEQFMMAIEVSYTVVSPPSNHQYNNMQLLSEAEMKYSRVLFSFTQPNNGVYHTKFLCSC